MPQPQSQKILRVGVIQGGKIIEEKLLRKRETVTVGLSPRNTIVVPASNLPSTFNIFELRGGTYYLRFSEQMDGRVSRGEAQLDFAALKSQGLAQKHGDSYVIPLSDSSKGKISLGEVTLLFQFVTPPPEAPKPVLPAAAKGNIWNSLDRGFTAILAGCLFLNFSAVWAVSKREVDTSEITLEELPDRFVKMIIPEKPPTPPKQKEEPQADGAAKKKTASSDDKPKAKSGGDKAKGPADAAAHKAAVQAAVASKGLLKILGAVGDSGGGALEDVLSSGGASGDIAGALSGAGGVAAATADGLAGGRKGGGTGAAAGIGSLGTSGGGNVSLGEKGAARISGRVLDATPEVESADCDRDTIARFVKLRIRAIQGCYERELKRNVGLKGKVQVRFTIGSSGRVTDVQIDENTLGSDAVAGCIKSIVRMWIFPIKDAECPVAYPFVFAPAS